MRTICCVCWRLKVNGEYTDEIVKSGPEDSHGYCPSCHDLAVEGFVKQRMAEDRKRIRKQVRDTLEGLK